MSNIPCQNNQTSQEPSGTMIAASVNNVSFSLSNTTLLQSHFFAQSNGVYTPDFPRRSLFKFNYTATSPNNTMVSSGTKIVVLSFKTSGACNAGHYQSSTNSKLDKIQKYVLSSVAKVV